MTSAFALLGMCTGFGLVLLAAGVLARRMDVLRGPRSQETRSLMSSAPDHSEIAPIRIGPRHWSEERLARLLGNEDLFGRQSRDLAITDRTLEQLSTKTALSTLLGAVVPLLAAGTLAAAGWRPPMLWVITSGCFGAAAGFFFPLFALRRSGQRARDQFLRALSSWLELVALAQAGGMGVESALEAASRISNDRGFLRIRRALQRSRHSGATPWAELGRLGNEIGIGELDELAASLELAGSEGARIRVSLRAKSESLRRRLLTEAAARASAATERLFLPSIVLMLGFLVFLMYPAAVSLSHSL